MRFVHETKPQRVCFGPAAPALVAELTASRIMLITTASNRATATRLAKDLPVALLYDDVAMHVPVEVADRARKAAGDHDVDAVLSIGGGSTTGLAKAVALTTGLPIVAVPTTYAGSEATDVWGLTKDGHKTTGVDPRVLPRTIVYDATLTLTLPVDLSVASGLNALAHCVDSMWAPNSDPIDQALALEGARALGEGLPQVVADPAGIEGREKMLYAAYLAATAFASAGSGLHHKICHVLGGMFGLPHAQTHAVVLPHVLALNAPAVPEVAARLAEVLNLDALLAEVNAPRALKDYGFEESDIPAAVEAILPVVPPSNPAAVTRENLQALLKAAWKGER